MIIVGTGRDLSLRENKINRELNNTWRRASRSILIFISPELCAFSVAPCETIVFNSYTE